MNIYSPIFILMLAIMMTFGDVKPKKKSILDFNDADLDRLYDEWEENDEDKLEEDELPVHKQTRKPIDLNKLRNQANSPEELMRLSKKGQMLMMFVRVGRVDGKPTRKRDTEHYIGLWEHSLHNNHVQLNSYIIEDDRAIFSFPNGEDAWEAKDFLLKQPNLVDVVLEGRTFEGPAASLSEKTEL